MMIDHGCVADTTTRVVAAVSAALVNPRGESAKLNDYTHRPEQTPGRNIVFPSIIRLAETSRARVSRAFRGQTAIGTARAKLACTEISFFFHLPSLPLSFSSFFFPSSPPLPFFSPPTHICRRSLYARGRYRRSFAPPPAKKRYL